MKAHITLASPFLFVDWQLVTCFLPRYAMFRAGYSKLKTLGVSYHVLKRYTPFVPVFSHASFPIPWSLPMSPSNRVCGATCLDWRLCCCCCISLLNNVDTFVLLWETCALYSLISKHMPVAPNQDGHIHVSPFAYLHCCFYDHHV